MKFLTTLIALTLCASAAWAEDWTTTDGRIYKDVKIGKHDAVNVDILDSDGGARVPISTLSPELQKQLGYDPAKADQQAKDQEAEVKAWRQKVVDSQQKGVVQLKRAFSLAFASPIKSAILYSLEPDSANGSNDVTFHRFKVLGQTKLDATQAQLARKEFQRAGDEWSGMSAMCFNPRHALRISSGGHVYDFVLCYECQELEFYIDDTAVGSIGASGSPAFLNELLTKAQVPLSESGIESPEKISTEEEKQRADDARWFAAMPKSVQARWDWTQARSSPTVDPALVRGLVNREYPEERPRILKLLEWFGSGAGPWSGYGVYEDIPGSLLFDYPTSAILAAVQSTTLNDAQVEGTARFFGQWDFSQRRPNDRALLPDSLKQLLLAHCLKSTDSDKIERAKKAFN